jgi:hypothetical protein
MRHARIAVLVSLSVGVLTLAACGSDTPTVSPTPRPTATPTPTPTPTPAGNELPPGMTCNPTPPPLLRMNIKIHSDDGGGRVVLDSNPIVENVDDYCHRVGLGSGKFCLTRAEGNDQRVACDYLATGKATDTGRWGPTWIGEGKPCGAEFSNCANHPDNQFMVIAKDKGEFQACVAADAPVAADGVRCSIFEYY